MIKNYLINNSMNLINGLGQYDSEKQEEIKYGLEGIYIAISKVIVILIISAILGLFKETILYLLLFNVLRVVAFGLHASKSIYCWISSSICFLLIPYLSSNYQLPLWFYIIVSSVSLLSFILYAPADTVKRPLINKKKRHIYKILSIIFSIVFIILIFIINNLLIKNLLTFALLLETILILPITYKIFNLPYNNYKNYQG